MTRAITRRSGSAQTPSRRTALRAGAAFAAGGALALLAAAPSQAAWPTFTTGAAGDHVWGLQRLLGERGYWCGAPDGYFGGLTEQAVYALQKSNGLTRDAIVGRDSLRALANWALPPVLDNGPGTRVVIDLQRQVLTVLRDGVLRLTLNTSTGNGEPYEYYGREVKATTPPGEFAVFSTYTKGWQTGPLGDLYRPQYFNGAIAVHGSDHIPPWPDSHGCARVSVAAMDMLWADIMTTGTPVRVV
ncbi:L,D-transpeptidase family protein [Ornithinimicrobium faecis]|uniref:L,D-transpeptidase family protein n=1 Tax=Ornithinimicrobium faecis TaxID=2934158 RepID=A0ABY4YPP6_9MICO|nr:MULTISPECIES: L,D-transpeptidase family protein [unclassified Ornithinimicrobium]USQ78674.1 L,D-transpeptidase family protein [Ornithinimicrobium sp. HY1793]